MDQITNIETKLRSMGYTQLRRESAKTVSILTDDNRVAVLEKVAATLGGSYDPDKGSSSVGATTVQGFTIKARPASKQGKASAGLDNEEAMINNINTFVAGGPLKICITDGIRKYVYDDVISCKGVGGDTANRKKADVLLCLKGGGEIPISIKKDNAEMWESADSYWAAQAKDIVDRLEKAGKISLQQSGSIWKIAPNVGVTATQAEKRAVVFGEDILRKGFVVIRTFRGDDFKLSADGTQLDIKVTTLIDSESQLTGDKDIYFLIRNDSSRKGSKIRPGLRVLAVSSTRINKNVLIIRNRQGVN